LVIIWFLYIGLQSTPMREPILQRHTLI